MAGLKMLLQHSKPSIIVPGATGKPGVANTFLTWNGHWSEQA
jgi:hypothetical protein